MKVRNPRTGKYDYVLHVDTIENINQKAENARAHQLDWQKSGVEFRTQQLMQFAEQLESRKEAIFEQLSIDTGRRKISRIEIEAVIGLIKGRCFTAQKHMQTSEERPSFNLQSVRIRQQLIPYPLVGAISPWNFPLLLACIDAIPALLAGSAVLLKPSEVTPRFIDIIEQAIESLPELNKVFKLIRGAAEAGKQVVNCTDVVCFTGSVATGRAIAVRCAERFIPAFLELGGKDPAIVLADADLEITTDAILLSGAGATGQACQSLERIYVAEEIHDDFVDLLLKKINPLEFNNDYDKGGQLGPLIFDKQAMKIQEQIQDAKDKGATVLSGGKIENLGGGLWMKPTVIVDVTHDMTIMTEETFGPVIPVMKFTSELDAIKMANDTDYGLSASVFSSNNDKAIQLAQEIDAGGISINDASLTNKVFDAEKNAFKLSGLYGSRMGAEGFTRFFRKKALLIQTEKPGTIHSQSE